jgi:hypothetical protein
MKDMSFTADYEQMLAISPLRAASRFDPFFDAYGLSLRQEADPRQRTVTLITKSPASPVAQALAVNLGRFQPATMEVHVILAQIAPQDALDNLGQALSQACLQHPETLIRWAKNRALLDAHERLTLGRTLCWTGDPLRRSDDARSAIDLVEDFSEAILAESNASFGAIWRASQPLPRTLFSSAPTSRNDAVPTRAAGPRGTAPETGVIQLAEYIRSRRH